MDIFLLSRIIAMEKIKNKKSRVQLLFEPIKQHKRIATQCREAYH